MREDTITPTAQATRPGRLAERAHGARRCVLPPAQDDLAARIAAHTLRVQAELARLNRKPTEGK
jgi:hypothetical protein